MFLMQTSERANRDRIVSAAAVAVVHLLLAWALITGLGARFVEDVSESLRVFDVAEAPPPPPEAQPEPAPIEAPPEPAAEAAPPNLESEPSPMVAPEPEVPIERPSPFVLAQIRGEGRETTAGAALEPGPGTGAGGEGTGRGAGGDGAGAGGGGGAVTRARLVRGRIDDDDYPRAAERQNIQGEVIVQLAVDPRGRVDRCSVMRLSGSPVLDSTTCALIQRRFRFEPARDAQGRAVADTAGWRQVWWIERGR